MSGSPGTETSSRNRRNPLSTKTKALVLLAAAGLSLDILGQPASGPVKLTLEDALQMAVQHNQALLAVRTTVQQSLAQEVTANLRPNPQLAATWAYLPLYKPEEGFLTYLRDSTEVDVGLSYLLERGQKRQYRFQAAKDATSMTRSQVEDNERTLKFQVASLFVNTQLAESTLELSRQNLTSFQKTVDLGETQFKAGSISENDFLKIKLQLIQFQTDVEQADLARIQSLSDLRQLLGHETVPPDYGLAGVFDYQPLIVTFDELQAKALQNRPDLRAAQQGVSSANSQYALAKANGKQDVTVGGNYSHTSGINAATVSMSIPLPIFDRNQGEIARTRYAISQAQYGLKGTSGQVMTDVRDAFESLQNSDRVVKLYRSGYLEISKKNRDISEYAYSRGATSLLDFLDAERSYRSTQLAYRQAVAAYLLALEQLYQAAGTRNLR
jgi:outer membrane protein, heavy metal efflux system